MLEEVPGPLELSSEELLELLPELPPGPTDLSLTTVVAEELPGAVVVVLELLVLPGALVPELPLELLELFPLAIYAPSEPKV